MQRFLIVVFLSCCCLFTTVQAQHIRLIDSSKDSRAYWTKWVNNLYEMGTDAKNDSFFVREETVRLLKDEAYRQATYPAAYSWPGTVGLLQQLELKKAFWHLINLYQEDTANRQLVLGTFFVYDSTMDMARILVSTFYTYAFADPRVCRITNNHPDIFRPDLLEQGQRALKEMVASVWAYRKQKHPGS